VELRKDRERLVLKVGDSGVGFRADPDAPSAGLGLLSMRERAKLLGGACRIESAPGLGTRVIAIIPLRNGTHEGDLR
jgi:signal transduction histidine kinase